MKMSNATYNKAKWLVMVLMPALTTLVGGLGAAYSWAHTELAVTTLTLITAFMGAVTMKSALDYNKEEADEKKNEN